jgi:hypothetical protein
MRGCELWRLGKSTIRRECSGGGQHAYLRGDGARRWEDGGRGLAGRRERRRRRPWERGAEVGERGEVVKWGPTPGMRSVRVTGVRPSASQRHRCARVRRDACAWFLAKTATHMQQSHDCAPATSPDILLWLCVVYDDVPVLPFLTNEYGGIYMYCTLVRLT